MEPVNSISDENPTILQWNIRSLKSNFCELKLLIQEINPVSICLQETGHGNHTSYPPSGYTIIPSPIKRTDGHERGVAILVRKNVNYKCLPLTTELQAVAVKLWHG